MVVGLGALPDLDQSFTGPALSLDRSGLRGHCEEVRGENTGVGDAIAKGGSNCAGVVAETPQSVSRTIKRTER